MLANDSIAEQVAKGDWMWNVIGPEVLKRTGNVRMAAIGNTGRWRSFYTSKKLIKTAADMKGVKMRTINSPLQIEFIKAMGGNPTPVAWGELYTALKSGVVEGTKNAATDIVPNKMHEVCKFVSLDEHADLFGFYWMSDKWLKSLPENYQNLVVEGVRQMAEIQSNWNKQYENQALMEFAASGGTVYVPTPEEKATFLPYRDIMADWFIEQYGPEYVKGWRAAIAQAEKEVAELNAQVLK
jgi:TRAP-type C4-dicarboxylate transport system substrate-binding protein